MPAAFLPPSKSTSMRMPCDVASPHKQRYSHDVQKGQADTASLCMILVMQSSGAEGTAPRHILTAVLRKLRKGVCRGTATCCCLPASNCCTAFEKHTLLPIATLALSPSIGRKTFEKNQNN